MARFVYALGILPVGEETAKRLAVISGAGAKGKVIPDKAAGSLCWFFAEQANVDRALAIEEKAGSKLKSAIELGVDVVNEV